MTDGAVRAARMRTSHLDTWLARRGWIGSSHEPAALGEIATAVGERPALWRRHVRHDEGERNAALLHRSPDLDVWVLSWLNAQETGLHDHGRSAGGVYVCHGSLLEDVLTVRSSGEIRLESRDRTAGSSFAFESSHIHGVRHRGLLPATSIHVYSPALLWMGHYGRTQDGSLARVERSYERELAAR